MREGRARRHFKVARTVPISSHHSHTAAQIAKDAKAARAEELRRAGELEAVEPNSNAESSYAHASASGDAVEVEVDNRTRHSR